MPASYQIDTDRRIILSSASGKLTDQDLREHQRAVLADPDFEPTLNQLWDLQQVEQLDISTAAIRDLANSRSYAAETKRAVVAPRDVLYGTARMFQTLHEEAPEDFQVFRDVGEAKGWLGIT
jgi:hypothetical protein